MAKITINPVQAGNGLETAINLRLQQIEDTFNDDVLWRAGFAGEPNKMEVDLDMNENDILNLLELTLGSVNVKADILQNQSDIEDLQTAVNILWPDDSPPFPAFNIRWGTISGDINDQLDLKAVTDGLQTNITAEETARISADSTLQSNIDAEAATRGAADTTLQNNIDTEEAARIAADALKVDLAGDIMDSGADLAFQGGGEVTGLPATPSATAAASKEYVETKAAAASDDGLAFAIAFGG